MKEFIPGPEETEEAFQKRVEYCSKLKETIPSAEESYAVPEYEIAPGWVPIVLSNEKLAPWHGGSAWIFQMAEGEPLGAYLQLRKNIWLYSREELIRHELCHVARMAYEEPRFEEFFAYRTGKGWRRLLGPIVQSSFESMLFVLSLIFVLFIDLFTLVDGNGQTIALWTKALPIGLILLASLRLTHRHRQLNRCLGTLKQLVGERAEALAFRLTDREIMECACPEKFLAYAKGQTSFRWQCLTDEFLLNSIELPAAEQLNDLCSSIA